MSDVILRLSVRDARGIREILRREVERGFEYSTAVGLEPASRAFDYMMRVQDAIEEGHDYYDKGTVS